MKTQCNTNRIEFLELGRREVIGDFDGRCNSSDGVGLLREVEQRTQIMERLSDCITVYHDPERIEHSVESLVKQRVKGLALGYEDLNDHDTLRQDVLLALLSDHPEASGSGRFRNQAIIEAYATGEYSYQQIADYFNLHFTMVGNIVRPTKTRL